MRCWWSGLLTLWLMLSWACGKEADPALQVSDIRLVETRSGERYLECRIVNPNSYPISKVQLVFSLFDSQNRRIGQVVISTPAIESGKAVTCSRYLDNPDVRAVRLQKALRF
jgi:hypothetical protein|nr:MAG: hypothetical protein KatS3mg041_1405 [Bacteroidota bacterium]